MAAQRVIVRNVEYFVCSYTGALIESYYFIPFGKNLAQQTGCYATLPILLRAVLDEEKGVFTERFQKIKHDCEVFYTQPDIPVQPPLPAEQCPLGTNALQEYLETLDLGMSWTLVSNGISVTDKKQKKQKTKK
jgi:hypothetical protein